MKINLLQKTVIPRYNGLFDLLLFSNDFDNKEHIAIVLGNVNNKENVLVRVHSECLTGDLIGSLTCDCGEQLNKSFELIEKEQLGIVIYLRQEGRGIGLRAKLDAMNLQQLGFDTYSANLELGFAEDYRSYDIAAHILLFLNIKSIKLITNNPQKISELTNNGIKINEIVKIQSTENEHNRKYLFCKKDKFEKLKIN